MNLFTTDHPLQSEPVPLSKRMKRRLILAALIYPAYLFLLGPYRAVEGRGFLDFAPEKFRFAVYYPIVPILITPGLNEVYFSYLNYWYADPNEAETTI